MNTKPINGQRPSDAPEVVPAGVLPLAERIAKSSQVCLFEHDAGTSELHVIFRTNAALYAYINFPREEFERVVRDEPSIGSYLIRCVTRRPKGGGELPYQFEKRALSDEQMAMWKDIGAKLDEDVRF